MNSVTPSAGPLFQCSRQLHSQPHTLLRPAKTLHCRSRPLRRQLQQCRRSRQLLAPVLQLLLQHLAQQPLPLPHRIVRILHRQRRQRIRVPAKTPLELASSRVSTPIDQPSDTMWCMVSSSHARPLPAAPAARGQRTLGQIERLRRLLGRQSAAPPSPLGRRTDRAPPAQSDSSAAMSCTGSPPPRTRAQDLMPPHDLVQAPLQHLRSNQPMETNRVRNVVERVPPSIARETTAAAAQTIAATPHLAQPAQ